MIYQVEAFRCGDGSYLLVQDGRPRHMEAEAFEAVFDPPAEPKKAKRAKKVARKPYKPRKPKAAAVKDFENEHSEATAGPGTGRKVCPKCFEGTGTRTKICDGCGYNF